MDSEVFFCRNAKDIAKCLYRSIGCRDVVLIGANVFVIGSFFTTKDTESTKREDQGLKAWIDFIAFDFLRVLPVLRG
jgi:hypothetical protein